MGSFDEGETQLPSLSDIRRWIAVSWKGVFGINIYETANNIFLFEFPNRYMAEQIIQRWGKIKFNLQWWNPIVGCEDSNQKAKSTWIRALGVWSQRIFTEIGNLCEGWC